MIFVNEDIDFIDKFYCTSLCKAYDLYLTKKYNHIEELNYNLGKLENGIIKSVYKGTSDECNNSLFHTHKFHNTENYIERLVDRNVEIKLLRSIRQILSFLTRTEHRKIVKTALKSDINVKIETLLNIDLSEITNIVKNLPYKEYLKSCSFQIGQCLGLLDNKEFYSKEDIYNEYNELKPFLMRNGGNLNILNIYKNKLLIKTKEYKFKNLKEYDV